MRLAPIIPAAAILIAASALSSCAALDQGAPPGPGAPPPAKSIDPARFYTGTWLEIGRRPLKLTDGCVAGSTTYTPTGKPGRYKVLDDCYEGSPQGKRKTVGGPGRIVDPGTNTRLHVRYWGIIGRDYQVLDRAEDYSWFISTDPSFRDLWIYTRQVPSPDQLARLKARASELGYDVGKLEFPETR